MLYLLKPTRAIEWADVPAKMTLSLVEEHGADLARLGWEPSERRDHDALLSLALRYGVKCSTGLVLDGGYVSNHDHPAQIARAHRDASAARAALAQSDTFMDSIAPGWTEYGREMDERVDESVGRVYTEAQERAGQALADREVDPELLTHWSALGGRSPVGLNGT